MARPDPPDGFVDITDISKLTGFFGDSCIPCANDFDCDAVLNAPDNCRNWPNHAQNLPPWLVPANDPDCDGFSAGVETSAGTNPILHCGTNAWPADLNNDGSSDIADISPLTANYGQSVPPSSTPLRHRPGPPGRRRRRSGHSADVRVFRRNVQLEARGAKSQFRRCAY